ncbi:alanine--tRNA ligase [Candidatus Margulisiibacteriota bacterium]
MKSSEIREKFLKFFESKEHKRLPGSSLIPSDPTVLLTLAGMLQFKPIFLGKEKAKQKRATTVQKCIRMNDISEVGKTSRHHTFFEMLGNFSFGDYFKKEAIAWAWELITKEFKVPEDKLYVAVYEKDDEAYNIWKDDIKLPKERIVRLGEDNNFWAAGPTGPCGPCAEIYFDLGKDRGCGDPKCGPGCDCERFLEIWNLVFIQYDRDEKGKLNPLPSKNIDTGMGLERIASVLQGVPTNFDTDLFVPILNSLRDMLKGKKADIHHPSQSVVSERIIADHARASTYLIADGVLPSNDGRGYVLRNLIRRAVRHGKLLGLREPFLHKLAAVVISVNGAAYPELTEQRDFISQIILTEEEHFGRTLEQGMILIGNIVKKSLSEGKSVISGKNAFVLHDTYGFPFELTKEIAAESDLSIDENGYQKEMEAQRKRGRTAGIGMELKEKLQEFSKYGPTKFLGYSSLSSDAKIIHIDEKDKLVILDKTPFYPEGGGQIGDMGKILFKDGECEVVDAFGLMDGVILHKLKDIKGLNVKMGVKAVVSKDVRELTARHHTATHLLQAALREVFGRQVRQTGSFVSHDRFRFDFTHFGEISKDDLEKVELRVNEKIKEKIKVDVQQVTLEEAKKRGALMLFGEKYGEKVRVIAIKGFSTELCGGTHVKNTSDIALFKIISEGSVSAGVRRIEAKVSDAAKEYLAGLAGQLWLRNKQMFADYEALELKKGYLASKPDTYYQFFRVTQEEIVNLNNAAEKADMFLINRLLEDFRKKNSGLQERVKDLGREAKIMELEDIKLKLDKYLQDAESVGDIKVITKTFRGYDMEFLREISDLLRNKFNKSVSILFNVHEGKVSFVLALSKDLVDEGFHAGKMSKEAAKAISGGGGGRPHIAEAGGRDPLKIGQVKDKVAEMIRQKKGI